LDYTRLKLKELAKSLTSSDKYKIKAKVAGLPKHYRYSLYNALSTEKCLKNKEISSASQSGKNRILKNPLILKQASDSVIDLRGQTLVEQLLHSVENRQSLEWQKECVKTLKAIETLTKKSKPNKQDILRLFSTLPKKLQYKMLTDLHTASSGKKGKKEWQSNPLLLTRFAHPKSLAKESILGFHLRIEREFQERCIKINTLFVPKRPMGKKEPFHQRVASAYATMGLSQKELPSLIENSLSEIGKGRMSGNFLSLKGIHNKAPIADPYFLLNYAQPKDKENARSEFFQQLRIDLGIPSEKDGEGYLFDVMATKLLWQFQRFNEKTKLVTHLNLEKIFSQALDLNTYSFMDPSYREKLLEEMAHHPNQPFLFMSGHTHHATMTILMGHYVVHIDTDNHHVIDKKSSITVYKRNAELTAEILKELANYRDRDKGYQENNLINQLRLEPIASIGKKYQKMGTCTKSSTNGALLALLVLEKTLKIQQKEGESPVTLSQAKIDKVYEDAYKGYKQFTTEQRLRNIGLFLHYLHENLPSLAQETSPLPWTILEGIATKLAIFHRPIQKDDVLDIASSIEHLVSHANKFDLQTTKRIRGCLISFLKQGKIPRDHKLFIQLKGQQALSKEGPEALGAKHALQQALRSNRREIGSFLTEYLKFYDINAQDEHGHTPIFYAASFASAKTLQFLIDQGARIDLKDKKGRNLLHWAAAPRGGRSGSPLERRFAPNGKQTKEVCKYLIQTNGTLLHEEDSQQNTPFDLLLKRDDHSWPLIKPLIKNGIRLNRKVASSLLAIAIARRETKLIDKLLKAYQKGNLVDLDLISRTYTPSNSYCTYSPLQLCIDQKDIGLLKRLLGDNPSKERLFETLAYSDSNEILQWAASMLISVAFDDLGKKEKNSLVAIAVKKSLPNLLKKLIESGAVLPKYSGYRPLIHAAIDNFGDEQIVDLLISHSPELLKETHPINGKTAEELILRRKQGEESWKKPYNKET